MRGLVLVPLTLAALSACSPASPVQLQLRSVLYTQPAGVALRDAQEASVGMNEQVCSINVGDGAVLGDSDPGGRERVLDGLGDRVLVADAHSLFVLDRRPNGLTRVHFDVPAHTARLTDAGVVAVVPVEGGCGVAWAAGTAPAEAFAVPGLRCEGELDLAVDPESGRAFMVDGQDLFRVDPDGQFVRWDGVGADRLAWDLDAGLVTLGVRGESALQTVDLDGRPVWSATVDGAIADVADSGPLGLIAVSVATDRGGSLVLVNARDGLAQAEYPLPEAPDVDFAEDGSTMALTGEGGVYFYDVTVLGGTLPDPQVVSVPRSNAALTGLGVAGAAGGALLAAVVIAD